MDINLESLLGRLKGDYDFIKLLGLGNFSRVYLVKHKFLQKEFTLKVLDFESIQRVLADRNMEDKAIQLERLKNRFINEAKILKDIKHPNIAEVDNIGVISDKADNIDLPYFTMKFIKGITLKDKINSDKCLDLESVFRISEDILSALQAIHDRKIGCWDIRPRNIIIEEKTGRAILVNLSSPRDFLSEILLTDPCPTTDTSPYRAPEQIQIDKEKIGPLTDIYSFGVVLYEMIARELPFKGVSCAELSKQHLNTPVPDIRKNNSNLPAGIERIIVRAMAKEPSKRYENTGALKKALEELVKKSELYDRDLYEVMMELGNAYEVIGPVEKKGGFSKVYRLKHRGLDSQQVLKIMKYGDFSGKDETDIEDFRGKFLQEGRLLAKIKHENIVRIHDLGITRPTKIPYSVREYVEGKRLDDLIKERAPLDFNQALIIAEQILPALGKMHNCKSPIIHKDVKPSNIIIEKETNQAILIDFGIAKDRLTEAKLSTTGAYLGTPAYMSPEQCNGMKDLDAATDIYSFAVVLYEMLTGGVPFKSDDNKPLDIMYAHTHFPVPDIMGKNPGLPLGIETVISKAMAKDPDERYKNTGEFLNALKRLKYVQEAEADESETILYHTREKTHKIHAFRYLILIPILALIVLAALIINPLGLFKEKDTKKTGVELLIFADSMEPGNESIGEKPRENQSKNFRQSGFFDLGKNPEMKKSEMLTLKMKTKNDAPLDNTIKEQLKRNMPPEDKYWDLIKGNQKGYYEITFIMGNEKNEHRMVYIPGKKLWIDKYEVSWRQLRKFLKAEKMKLPPRKNKQYIKEDDEYPAVVTYEIALEYCDRYGFRLPTKAEWEYVAAMGKFKYPWGNESPDQGGIKRANFDSFEDGFEGTAPVYSFEKFSSPFGVVNMAGNAWEWVQGKNLKGGGFFSDKGDLKIEKEKPGKSGIEEGFRCIKEEK